MRHFLAEINILIDIRVSIKEDIRITNLISFNTNGRDENNKPYIYYTMPFIEFGDLFKMVES